MEQTAPQASQPHIESPAQVPARRWWAGVKRAAKEAKSDRITLIAAGVGFWWFLAVFPMIIAAVGMLVLILIALVRFFFPDVFERLKNEVSNLFDASSG